MPRPEFLLRAPAPESMAVIRTRGETCHADPAYYAAHRFEINPTGAEVGFFLAGTRRPVMKVEVDHYTVAEAIESWRWYLDQWLRTGEMPGEAPQFTLEQVRAVRDGTVSHVIVQAGENGVSYNPHVHPAIAASEAYMRREYVVQAKVLSPAVSTNVDTVRALVRMVLPALDLGNWGTVTIHDEYLTPSGLGEAELAYHTDAPNFGVYQAATLEAFNEALAARQRYYDETLGVLHRQIDETRLTEGAIRWLDDVAAHEAPRIRSGAAPLPLNSWSGLENAGTAFEDDEEMDAPPSIEEMRAQWGPISATAASTLEAMLAPLAAHQADFPELPITAAQSHVAQRAAWLTSRPRKARRPARV